MKIGSAVSMLALIAACATSSALAQDAARELPPPVSYPVMKQLVATPGAWRQFLAEHRQLPTAPPTTAPPAGTPAWTPLKKLLPGGAGASNPLLLTDGTVMVHVACTSIWYKLTPDIKGSYVDGTWSVLKAMPANYQPLYFASAVLPDGRVIVEGGEYAWNGNACATAWTNLGEIYDPTSNSWTAVNPPGEWTSIGNASSTLLADATYLLSNALTRETATLDLGTLTWTAAGAKKYDENDDENWTLLPDGDVLTVDAFADRNGCLPQAEEYVPKSGKWVGAGNTIATLSGCSGAIKTYDGPTQILQPGGTVFAFGAGTSTDTQNFPVPTAEYDTGTLAWTQGPNLPAVGGINYTMADSPAAVLTDGDIVVAASPGAWDKTTPYPNPVHFFIFDGTTFTQIGDFADSASLSAYDVNFLVLPTGEILGTETTMPNIQILPVQGKAKPAWKPTVKSISSTALSAGGTYSVTGKQLSGLTYGAVFGADAQANTNFPLVRIVNNATKHVFYARTTFASASVKPGAVSTAQFTVPATIESGPSDLYVVANGIASKPVAVTTAAP
jgi:hypothetical protein